MQGRPAKRQGGLAFFRSVPALLLIAAEPLNRIMNKALCGRGCIADIPSNVERSQDKLVALPKNRIP